MDAFLFRDPKGGTDGITHYLTLRTIDSLPVGIAPSDDELDKGYGRCELQWQDLREIVADILFSLDGECYKIGDFVVMPNHVHLLVGMYPGRNCGDQIRDWMEQSTRLINATRRRTGDFWHRDPIDVRVRDWDDFDERRKYIRREPKRAGLRVGEFYHHVADED